MELTEIRERMSTKDRENSTSSALSENVEDRVCNDAQIDTIVIRACKH